MREGNCQRWRLFTADLSGIAAHRLDDTEALEAILTRILHDALGQAPRRWVRHRFQPQGVSLVGLGARIRVAVHTWPELRAATLDVWSDCAGVRAAVERCALALGGRAVARRPYAAPAQLSGE